MEQAAAAAVETASPIDSSALGAPLCRVKRDQLGASTGRASDQGRGAVAPAKIRTIQSPARGARVRSTHSGLASPVIQCDYRVVEASARATPPPQTQTSTAPLLRVEVCQVDKSSVPHIADCLLRPVPPSRTLAHRCPALAAHWLRKRNGGVVPEQVDWLERAKAFFACVNCGRPRALIIRSVCHNNVQKGTLPRCRSCAGYARRKEENTLAVWLPASLNALVLTADEPRGPWELSRSHRRPLRWRCLDRPEHPSYEACVPKLGKRRTEPELPPCPTCNSLLELFPTIAREWHPQRNGDLSPAAVTAGVHTEYWWLCVRGHEWEQSVVARTSQRSGCPDCSLRHTSAPEIRLWAELAALFNSDRDCLSQLGLRGCDQVACSCLVSDVHVRHNETVAGLGRRIGRIDIVLRRANDQKPLLALEYDGAYHHRERLRDDERKSATLSRSGIFVMRVREKPLPLVGFDDLSVPPQARRHDGSPETARQVITVLLNRGALPEGSACRGRRYASQDIQLGAELASEVLSRGVAARVEPSILQSAPSLVEGWWHPTANLECRPIARPIDAPPRWFWPGPVTPECVSPDSSRPLWWVCPLGDEFPATARDLLAGRRCPVCAGKRVTRRTALWTTHPPVAGELLDKAVGWLVSHGSGRVVEWHCPCAHIWRAPVKARVLGGRCPSCHRQPAWVACPARAV